MMLCCVDIAVMLPSISLISISVSFIFQLQGKNSGFPLNRRENDVIHDATQR